mgnify:CR=1 FL=1
MDSVQVSACLLESLIANTEFLLTALPDDGDAVEKLRRMLEGDLLQAMELLTSSPNESD